MRSERTECTTARRGFAAALVVLGTGFIGISAPKAAHAQASLPSVVPHFRLKLGVFTPADSATRSAFGKVLPSGEIDAQVPVGSSGISLLSVGYTEGRRDGRNFRDIPVGLSQVTYAGNPASGLTGNIYYGGGFAFHFMHVSGGGQASESKKPFGAFIQVGYQSPLSYFIEAKYNLVSASVGGVKANGLVLYLGKRL